MFEFEENQRARKEIVANFNKEINVLGLEHIKANPWCVIDMPAEIPAAWLKTALEKQPLLVLLGSFTSVHSSWKEKLESIQPGSVEHLRISLSSLCHVLGYDINDEKSKEIFRNEALRYFKTGGLDIKETDISFDGIDFQDVDRKF